jgi:thiamine phosphate synthase YjbQ (UPF0047 family)
LTIQENADPSARRDIEAWLERTVREDDPAWTHVDEGPDDMPSHIRAMLTDVSLSIPIVDGQLPWARGRASFSASIGASDTRDRCW